ncbi:unnamed protein product [Aspergillus oryzae]|nr:unnamed protein product [Aspergillus oryzae]
MAQENHQSLGGQTDLIQTFIPIVLWVYRLAEKKIRSNNSLSSETNVNDNNQADPTADPQSLAAAAEYANYYREFLNELVGSIRNEDKAMVH